MSQDLKQYENLIEQLKPMVAEPEFNQILNQIASDVPKEKRFLIKMEVRRLAKPCIRSLDLRGQVEDECELYNFKGVNHYLDEASIEVFEQQIRIFGQYCFGVYEAVLDHVKRSTQEARLQAEQAANDDAEDANGNTVTKRYIAPVVNLLNYAHRDHERMNFSVALEIFTDQRKSVRATSIDVSTNGIKIKTQSDYAFKPKENVSVYFRGLETEFALDKRDAVMYQIIRSDPNGKDQLVRLRRATEFPNPPFDQFLEKFIHGNKRRYKVNLQNTIDAIINKSCEQYFSPRYPSLPIFVDEIDGEFKPRFAMSNVTNREILDYWTDENDELRVGYLLERNRLKRLCESDSDFEMFVFAFNHIQNDRIYFYSATIQELQSQAKLRELYLGFGSRKISWRVFKMKALHTSSEHAHAPLSIPDSISKKIKQQNAPPPPRLMARLKDTTRIVHITDITSEFGQQAYHHFKVDRAAIKNLRIFGHPRNKPPGEIKTFRYKYDEKRMETRYLVRSPAEVTYEGITLQGISEDVSYHGLRIELKEPFHGAADSRVVLSFPKLQSITTKYDVTQLHYRVVNISSEYSVLHLRVIAGEEGKPAIAFFEELIKQNKTKLETYPEEEEYPGIGHALRCMNAKSTAITSFVVQKKKGRFFPYACVTPTTPTRVRHIASYLAKQDQVDLEFLFRDRVSEDPFIDIGFKQARAENRSVSNELFIMFDPTQTKQRMTLMSRWAHKFASDKVRHSFIDEALRRGQFIAVRAVLTNADRPDMDMLQLEMNYVSMYALHRAKELEENLWAISGCVHLVDITDEVLLRYRFGLDVMQANQKIPDMHRVEPDGIKALLGSN